MFEHEFALHLLLKKLLLLNYITNFIFLGPLVIRKALFFKKIFAPAPALENDVDIRYGQFLNKNENYHFMPLRFKISSVVQEITTYKEINFSSF